MENWSFWSAPYGFEKGLRGLPIISPSPRRYFQIKIDFINDFTTAGKLDSITFVFSQPPAAHEIAGEIWPIEVKPAKLTRFTYAVKPIIEDDDTGFDSLEIRTPVEASRVKSVRIDSVEVPFTTDFFDNPTRFIVHFPKIEIDRTLLEVDFDTVVLRYGTAFIGRVFDSQLDQVPQMVFPGNASQELPGDDFSVKIALESPLIASIKASSNPFTPNGDGFNDVTGISYSLLHLTAPAPVFVEMYDLSGSLVRRVYEGHDSSGVYSRIWDGRNDRGELLPPGIYIYRISVKADSGRDVKVGVVSLVY